MNNFSVYLPFTNKQIDDFYAFNQTLSKSQIKYLYNALPINAIMDNTGYEQNRGYYQEINTLSDFMRYVEYATNKGFEVIYLLNSVRGFQLDSLEYNDSLQRLDRLIKALYNSGCTKIKVGNTQLIQYLADTAPYMTPILSTVLGYKDIMQYKQLKDQYPKIESAVMTYDENRNIPLIQNIQKLGIAPKLMVNEGCITGCPYRHSHDVFPIQSVRYANEISEHWVNIQKHAFTDNCSCVINNDFFSYLFKCNIIYPHQIEEYNKYGVYDFKIAGRGENTIKSGFQDEFIKNYIKWVEDDTNYNDITVTYFNRFLCNNTQSLDKYNDITIGKLRDYLPKLQHFEQFGDRCNANCGINCNYCEKQANLFKESIK